MAALYAAQSEFQKVKCFRAFLWIYNIGVPLTTVMLLVRGVFQVQGAPLSPAADASIAGIAGIVHILTGVGIVLLLLSLKKPEENGEDDHV